MAATAITGWRTIPIGILDYVPVFTLTPRFILSVRALCARDLRGRCEPCHHDVDTEFGIGSSVSWSVARGTTIIFAGGSEDELEQDEDISMSERKTRCAGSGF